MAGKMIYNNHEGNQVKEDFESSDIDNIFAEFERIHLHNPRSSIQFTDDHVWLLYDKISQDLNSWCVLRSAFK